MIYHRHMRTAVVEVLTYLHPEIRYSKKAVELLMVTVAAESNGGRWFRQLGGGPARGLFQIEPETEKDCFKNYLNYPRREFLKAKIMSLASPVGKWDLELNIAYQIAIARLVYWRKPQLIPGVQWYKDRLTPASIQSLAAYWKQHYNTDWGKGRIRDAVKKYGKFTSGTMDF